MVSTQIHQRKSSDASQSPLHWNGWKVGKDKKKRGYAAILSTISRKVGENVGFSCLKWRLQFTIPWVTILSIREGMRHQQNGSLSLPLGFSSRRNYLSRTESAASKSPGHQESENEKDKCRGLQRLPRFRLWVRCTCSKSSYSLGSVLDSSEDIILLAYSIAIFLTRFPAQPLFLLSELIRNDALWKLTSNAWGRPQ